MKMKQNTSFKIYWCRNGANLHKINYYWVCAAENELRCYANYLCFQTQLIAILKQDKTYKEKNMNIPEMTRFFFSTNQSNKKKTNLGKIYQCFDYDMDTIIGRKIVASFLHYEILSEQRLIVMWIVHAFPTEKIR